VGLRVRGTWRFKEIDPLPRREGTSRNGWQPTADALLTMERRTQPVAAGGNGFRLFLRVTGPGRFAGDCRLLQPRGSIKAPSAALCRTFHLRRGQLSTCVRLITAMNLCRLGVRCARGQLSESDGTRTRDVRRDRPVGHNHARRRTPLNWSIAGPFTPTPPLLRIVEQIVRPTFGPRVDHGVLSSHTTRGSVCEDVVRFTTLRHQRGPHAQLPALGRLVMRRRSCGRCCAGEFRRSFG
jgi:hypothetical protein